MDWLVRSTIRTPIRPAVSRRWDRYSVQLRAGRRTNGISEITVKAHRWQVMQKMKADSLVDLVRIAVKLGPPARSVHVA